MFLLIPVFAAAVFPPTITKSFTPPVVKVNQTSVVTITITNPNDTALTGASVTDFFGTPLSTAGTPSTTCGAGAVLSSGPPFLMMQNGTIPANGSCTITTLAFATATGSFQNVTGSVFSNGPASLGGASAVLTVVTDIPALPPWALAALALMLAAVGWITSSSRSS